MGFFRVTDEERAAGLAAAAKAAEDQGRARRPAIEVVDAERTAAWAQLGAPEGMTVDRIGASNAESALAAFAEYAGAIALRREDLWLVHLERGDNNESNTPRAVCVVYADSPEYAAARERYWATHAARTPFDAVIGSVAQEPVEQVAPDALRAMLREQLAADA